MALIKCPDCGKMFSEYAECCPECGCPVADAKAANKQDIYIPTQSEESEKQNSKASYPDTSKEEYEKKDPTTPISDFISNESENNEGTELEEEETANSFTKHLGYGFLSALVIVLLIIGFVNHNKYASTESETEIKSDTIGNNEVDNNSCSDMELLAKAMSNYNYYDWFNAAQLLALNEVCPFRNGLVKVTRVIGEHEKYGFINSKGVEIVPCKYNMANNFSEGFSLVGNEKGKYGFINTEGKEIIPCRFESAQSFHEGLAAVCESENGKWGYINNEGKVIIPFEYDGAGDFNEGMAMVIMGATVGYINKSGKTIIPFEYKGGLDFSDGIALVEDDLGASYIDKSGEVVFFVDFREYSHANSFHDGLALVVCREDTEDEKNWRKGYINKEEKNVIPCEYARAHSFKEGIAAVAIHNESGKLKWGYINTKGEVIIPFEYDGGNDANEFGKMEDVGDFSEGLAYVCRNGKWGYIDKQGTVVIPIKYDIVSNFSEGYAQVILNGKCGYIDTKGNCTLNQ